jgi:hypothetical protein
MNRRRFLSTTMLSSLGLAALTAPAKAFTASTCTGTESAACRELVRHNALIDELLASLDKQGLTEEQRRTALAAATCPFCGQPLVD